MSLMNAWRGLKMGFLAAALMCASSLVVTSGCSEKCDTCATRDCQSCPGPCDHAHPEGNAEKK